MSVNPACLLARKLDTLFWLSMQCRANRHESHVLIPGLLQAGSPGSGQDTACSVLTTSVVAFHQVWTAPNRLALGLGAINFLMS